MSFKCLANDAVAKSIKTFWLVCIASKFMNHWYFFEPNHKWLQSINIPTYTTYLNLISESLTNERSEKSVKFINNCFSVQKKTNKIWHWMLSFRFRFKWKYHLNLWNNSNYLIALGHVICLRSNISFIRQVNRFFLVFLKSDSKNLYLTWRLNTYFTVSKTSTWNVTYYPAREISSGVSKVQHCQNIFQTRNT